MGKLTVCMWCQKVIKRDPMSVTGWRHASSGQVECEPKGKAMPLKELDARWM